MGKNNLFFCVLLLFTGSSLYGQTDRYAVYFSDKLQSPYSIEKPEEFLSARSIERRLRQNIPITQQDFPVNENYVSIVKENADRISYRSKWFNALLVEATEVQIEEIKMLPFVLKVDYVAPGTQAQRVERARPEINGEGKKLSNNSDYQNEILGVDLMHEAGFRGENILIGVFDGGFLNVDVLPFFNHVFENNKMLYTYDYVRGGDYVYDYDRHGTEVLSTIGAYKENEIVGTAYNADFLLCITEEVASEYRIEEYNWLFAAEAADSVGVDVINSSLGYNTFTDPVMDYTYEDLNGDAAVVSIAATIASEKGILIVSSAGNEGSKTWKYLTAPSDAFNSLVVGSVTAALERSSFSSIGPTADGRLKPDVMALGTSAVVGKVDGSVGFNNGTSFSSPQIAGLAAGVWQANRNLTVIELITRLQNSGTNSSLPSNSMGFGVPHFVRAHNNIVLSVEENSLINFKVYPNPIATGELFISLKKGSPIGNLEVKVHGSDGKLLLEKNIHAHLEKRVASLDVSELPSGIFTITINHKKVTEKLKILKN